MKLGLKERYEGVDSEYAVGVGPIWRGKRRSRKTKHVSASGRKQLRGAAAAKTRR